LGQRNKYHENSFTCMKRSGTEGRLKEIQRKRVKRPSGPDTTEREEVRAQKGGARDGH